MDKYSQLMAKVREVELLSSISSILSWDTETMLPQGASNTRGLQNEALAGVIHEKSVSPEILKLIESIDPSSLNELQQRNYHLIKKEYLKATMTPSRLVLELAKVSNQTVLQWREAKEKADYNIVKAKLSELFKLVKEQAEIYGEILGLSPYAAMVDCHDEGRSLEDIDATFAKLKGFLPGFLERVIDKQKLPDKDEYIYNKNAQKALCRELMSIMQFDFSRGRLDESSHPFCGGTVDDIRLTTNYREDYFHGGIFATMHETGHALYEQNIPLEVRFTPAGSSAGMSIHESQSLFMENQVGSDPRFLADLHGLICKYFPASGLSLEQLKLQKMEAGKGFIRIHADEVSYPLHVIMRYEIERDLFAGAIDIADVRDVWNQKFKDYFALVPPDDAKGCVQDIHWYWGAFGYFPCYSLGAMIAAQIAKIMQQRGLVYNNFDSFVEIKRMMHELVYQHANVLGPKKYKLLNELAGVDAADCFIESLRQRYPH